MIHDFNQKLEFSLGERETFDINLLTHCFAKCKTVQKTDIDTDKLGVDYVATLLDGAQIYIDAKAREKGASKYWQNKEPELALEIWSAKPTSTNSGKIGWTLNNSSPVNYILYTFDKSDCDRFFLLPFQMLRTAFYNNGKKWKETYGAKTQYSNGWQSEAVFVPASVVISEINRQMTGIAYYQYSI